MAAAYKVSSSERCLSVSLQIAILKVLVSYPDGRATIAELKSDLSFLHTTGRDWTSRLRRLAARAPDLDIFGQKLVVRDNSGWQITAEGKTVLDLLESGGSLATASAPEQPLPSPPPQQAPLLLAKRQRKAVRRARARLVHLLRRRSV
jgi:hypothetical protein